MGKNMGKTFARVNLPVSTSGTAKRNLNLPVAVE